MTPAGIVAGTLRVPSAASVWRKSRSERLYDGLPRPSSGDFRRSWTAVEGRPTQEDRRGMVLILVLVVIAILTLAGFAFSELMLTERKAALVSARQAQARALAESGLEMTRLFVVRDRDAQNEAGGWYDNIERFKGVLVAEEDTPGRFAIVAPAMDKEGVPAGIRFGLEDESTRLNLNTLVLADKSAENGGRQILAALPGMTDEIADAILDWIDEDSESREFGAEAEYYSSLVPAYAPKNGPLETVEELLLVRGVTPWLLFGADANRNGRIDPGEPAAESIGDVDNSDGSMNRGWAAYLTLYSMELNTNPDGELKIDLNQDDMENLFNELSDRVGAEWATFIVAYRQNGPYTGSKVGELPGAGRLDLKKKGAVELSTVLDLIGVRVRVTYEGEKEATVLESPFPNVPGVMNAYLPVLMDQTTVNPSPLIPGRININQAPRVLLEGIPGMDEEIVEAILAERTLNPVEADPRRRHETWLLAEGHVTLDQMKALMPFVTGGGSVFRAQTIGYFDRGGPAVRVEAVLDATAKPARIVFWRDLSHLGRGYELTTLGIDAPEW